MAAAIGAPTTLSAKAITETQAAVGPHLSRALRPASAAIAAAPAIALKTPSRRKVQRAPGDMSAPKLATIDQITPNIPTTIPTHRTT